MYFFTCQSFKSWQITRFAKVKNIKLLKMLQTAILTTQRFGQLHSVPVTFNFANNHSYGYLHRYIFFTDITIIQTNKIIMGRCNLKSVGI
jgi:hypothetical protein